MDSLLLSLGVIFLAELGDKSQLLALAFATRYRARTVLLAITLATAAVHLGSVALGAAVGAALPARPLSLAAGAAFVAFGAWTLRGDRLTDADAARVRRRGTALAAVGGAFVLAELGDKTMLATVALATSGSWWGTWVGSTLGMVAADALAIAVGVALGRRLPDRPVRLGAAVLFFAFGGWLAVRGLAG